MSVKAAVLHAPGTNRDREAAWACELAGATPEIVPLGALVAGPTLGLAGPWRSALPRWACSPTRTLGAR